MPVLSNYLPQMLQFESRAILRDEDTYPNPEAFNPSRYMLADGKLDTDVPDPMDVAFGFGRRSCPGRHFAVDQLWLIIAQVLSVFNIEKAVDASGNIVEPTEEFTSGLARYVSSDRIESI